MRTGLAVLVVSLLLPTAAAAAPPPSPTLPAEVTAALSRPVCADPDLVSRLVAAETGRRVLARRYLARHPRMQAHELRLADLRRATASAPAADAQACGRIAAILADLRDRSRIEEHRLATSLGAAHPERVELGLRITFLGECLAVLTARGITATVGVAGPGESEASLAEAEGRLRYLLTVYTDKHPRVMAARAQIAFARRKLGASPPAADLATCRARWAAFSLFIRRLREAPATADTDRLQREFALDRLVGDRAKLRITPGCP